MTDFTMLLQGGRQRVVGDDPRAHDDDGLDERPARRVGHADDRALEHVRVRSRASSTSGAAML